MKKVCKKNDRFFYTLFLNITICFYIKIPLKYAKFIDKKLKNYIIKTLIYIYVELNIILLWLI